MRGAAYALRSRFYVTDSGAARTESGGAFCARRFAGTPVGARVAVSATCSSLSDVVGEGRRPPPADAGATSEGLALPAAAMAAGAAIGEGTAAAAVAGAWTTAADRGADFAAANAVPAAKSTGNFTGGAVARAADEPAVAGRAAGPLTTEDAATWVLRGIVTVRAAKPDKVRSSAVGLL